MKNLIKNSCKGIVVLLIMTGCYDIFEEDIEDSNVNIISPADNFETESLTLTFWWEALDGAREYEFQLVSERFDEVYDIVADTLLEDTEFQVQLYAGTFQWRIRAINNGYATNFETRNLTIIESDDLSKQYVVLINPNDGLALNDTTVEFSWEALNMADEYVLQVYGDDFEYDTTLEESSVRLALESTDRTYNWLVTAKNDSSKKSSSSYEFNIDLTNPESSVLIIPSDNASLGIDEDVVFEWSNSSSDIKGDSLWIYDEEENIVSGYPVWITYGNFYSIEAGKLEAGTYLWQLKSFDKAGNDSADSDSFSFEIAD